MDSGDHTRRPRPASKIGAVVALLGLLAAPGARAAEGQIYDVFAKTLAPIASSVFGGAAGQPGAMVIECSVAGASGKLRPAQGAQLRLAVQAPDHLRVDLAYNGMVLTACRAGKELWATPAEAMRSLAQAAGIKVGQTAPDAAVPPLIPLALDPQLLVFLPVVFDVEDLGSQDIDGTPHRGLRLGLMPEIKKSTKAADFDARAWINPAHEPRRVTVNGEDYSLELEVDKINFADRLPSAAWDPPADTEVLRLPASALNELFEKMLSQKITLPGIGNKPGASGEQ
jgi:hypothetical protein